MRNSIISICLFLIILGIVIKVQARNDEKNPPKLSELDTYKLKFEVLEVQNLNYQIQDLSTQRDKTVQEVNQLINSLYITYKVNRKDFIFDIQSFSFISVKK